MIVGVPAEWSATERRVALVPVSVPALAKAGIDVLVERGAGSKAGFPDAGYEEKNARLAADANELYSSADVVVCLSRPSSGTPGSGMESLRSGQVVVGLLDPWGSPEAAKQLAARGVTSFALELLPRISRAQSMDVLSSMATIAGYKAVLLAAAELGKMYPMMITAAGTITPSRVLVIGAGVAGLQAIATAQRLGAVVVAYDIRPDVREQVESLGASFLELELETADAEDKGGYARAMDEEFYQRQRELMATAVAANDVVITTAAVPGRRAPVLITAAMVEGMKAGSVIVDLAADGGGNCELTRAGETVEAHGVRIDGPLNLPATVPYHASQMYAKNISAFVLNMVQGADLSLDFEDEIVAGSLLTRDGRVANQHVRELLGEAPPTPSEGSND